MWFGYTNPRGYFARTGVITRLQLCGEWVALYIYELANNEWSDQNLIQENHVLMFHNVFSSKDPTLFSGTLRTNLDPLRKHSDDALWMVLQHADLKNYVMNLAGGLNYVCEENGLNLRYSG